MDKFKYCIKICEDNPSEVTFESQSSPVMIYRFYKKSSETYACMACRRSGKQRTITIRNGYIVGNKNPEVDHHPDCR